LQAEYRILNHWGGFRGIGERDQVKKIALMNQPGVSCLEMFSPCDGTKNRCTMPVGLEFQTEIPVPGKSE
jgi:hypothetical protein